MMHDFDTAVVSVTAAMLTLTPASSTPEPTKRTPIMHPYHDIRLRQQPCGHCKLLTLTATMLTLTQASNTQVLMK